MNYKILIAEAEDEAAPSYEPIAIVASLDEGREIAHSDLNRRLGLLSKDEDPGLCPYEYKVWSQGNDGWMVEGVVWSQDGRHVEH